MLLGIPTTAGSQDPTPEASSLVTASGDFAGLVDIGGRSLYLECHGQGSPTVILEAGLLSRSDIWSRDSREPAGQRTMVLPGVAAFTRVCAYDRPGTIGEVNPDLDPDGPLFLPSRSDPVPQPRTVKEMVADLHALLVSADVPGPYVLAGHSAGGLVVRLYASTYPDKVVGMVLVDATPENVWLRFQEALTPAQWDEFEALTVTNRELQEAYPEAERLWTAPLGDDDSVSQVRQAQMETPLRSMPLVILSHGIPFAAPFAGWPSDTMEGIMLALQDDLARLVPDAHHIIATESGHDIHQDQPELVIAAIREVVEAVRDPGTWTTGIATPPAQEATNSLASDVASSTASGDVAGLVDIGDGRRLYLECAGQGGPTVVLEAGFRTRADLWSDDLIQPEAPRTMVFPGVAAFTRVCAYDRPGTTTVIEGALLPSRSDPVAMPRTAAESVHDLHDLLEAANVPGPYVLVGHSYGGMLMRLYASTYPDEVVGMVLVDAFSEGLEAQMTAEQWTAYAAIFQPVPEALAGYPDLEFTDLDVSVSQVRDATDALPLPPLPLVVLSRGQAMAMPADLPGGLTGEGLERAWTVEQDRLAALLPGARHVIAGESEHYIQLQQPELVIDAVRQVVEAVRDPSSWAMSITGTPSP